MDAPPPLPDIARYRPAQPLHPAPEALRAAARMLLAAKQPLLLPGRVGRGMDAWQQRIALAEMLGARVLTDLKTPAAFPTGHGLHARAVKFLTEESKRILAESDVILSLDWIDLAGTLKQAWGNQAVSAKIIQVSADSLVHNGWSMDHQGLPPADIYLLAEPDAATACLLEEIRKSRRQAPRSARRKQPELRSVAGRDQSIGVGALADAVNELMAREPVSLVKINLGWPARAMRHDHPLEFLGNDGGGGVGSGVGIGIGAALALRGSGRLPLAVLGDGDFVMGASGLWTAARHGIALMIVVANNLSFFNDEMHQERMALKRGRPKENRWIGQRIAGPDIDIAGLARAHGALGMGPISRAADLRKALRSGAARTRRGSVVVIDVRVAAEYDAALASLMVRGDK